MINLDLKYLAIVKEILATLIPDEHVWLFGSRVTDKIKPHSDIDLAIINKTPISPKIMMQLEEDFAESVLPYKVDIVEWSSLSNEFKKIIESRYEVIQ